jgi:hypothetical protein
MSAVIKGNQLITWGTGAAAGLGVVQSASTKLGGEKVELQDEDGETFCVIYFDDKNECEFEALMQSGVTPPDRGATITIGGVTAALVDEVELRWANKDAQRISIRATKYSF